jgi:endoglucanase
MYLPHLARLAFASTALAQNLQPLHTSSRWILDSNNNRIKLRCINWAGHMEASVPEGLQHQTVDDIVSTIASARFNCVRLTWSVDMALDMDVSVSDSFGTLAARTGADPGAVNSLWNAVREKNQWISNATVGDAFAKVVDTLGGKGLRVILDNHVSHASWCCNYTDGNGWWDQAAGYNADNSRYFNTDNWVKGLGIIAAWAKNHPAVAGIGLRNELRQLPAIQPEDEWYTYIAKGADAVRDANSDLLIIMGGGWSATDMLFLRTKPLDRSPWGNKVVWEWHTYTFSPAYIGTFGNCDAWKSAVGLSTGFLLTQNRPYTGPLWLSEFGVQMSGAGGSDANHGLSDKDAGYLNCLIGYMSGNDGDWALWAVQGSYYVRDGNVDSDENWGLLTSDWSTLRNPGVMGMLGSMWDQTQGP